MPDFTPLKALHVERVVNFWLWNWDVTYNIRPVSWRGDGNPSITVNLIGRVIFATPPYVTDNIDAYQGGVLQY